MRVALVILDGLPVRHARPDVTPVLCGLGDVRLGRAVMTSATYPNHATFATGRAPVEHGLLANWVVGVDGRARPAAQVGPIGPTLFTACRAAGLRSVAVLGDQYLVSVMGASVADVCWPPTAELAEGVDADAHGYAVDAAVVTAASPLLDAFDMAVLHINGPDTAGHVLGPDSSEALDAYRSSDAALGQLLDALQPAWGDTVVIVLSDHDMETLDDRPPIDLWAEVASRGLDALPIPEGNGTVVWGTADQAWLDDVDGVAGWEQVTERATVAWADVGRWFALPPGMDGGAERGQHGGGTTRDQVAVVGGGHPAAADLTARVGDGPVDATEWAPAIAGLLGATLRP